MARFNNFIENFQKDHTVLLELISSFQGAVETTNREKAKTILRRIEDMADGHFSFEENYLYPRLRRLILEITGNLGNEQETMRNFLVKSRELLNKNKLGKNEMSYILEMLPRLSKLFEDCNDLISLAKKFNKPDRDDLNQRYQECREERNVVNV